MRRKLVGGFIGVFVVIFLAALNAAEHWTFVEHLLETLRKHGAVGIMVADIIMSRVTPLVIALVTIVMIIDVWRKQRESQTGQPEKAVIYAREKQTIYEINGHYLPGLPTDHGWQFAYGLEKIPSYKAPQDGDGIGGIEMFCPNGTYAIQHVVPEPYASLTDELQVNVKYGRDAMFWVGVNVTSRDGVSNPDCRWLKIVVGREQPHELKDYPKEHVIPVMPNVLQNGWVGFRLRLPDLVAASVGRIGYIYHSLKAVRMRSCISISPIKFLSPAPVDEQQANLLS